jgi:uncharacterized protein YndB with AHSA1/START domain
MIDVDHQISSVQRRVGSRVLAAGEARTVTVTRRFDTTVDDLWDACTNAERIPRWFLPVTGELELGGRYQLEGNAGGVIEACDPPLGFDATWEYDGEVGWIEVRISAAGNGAELRLEHLAHVDDERWWEFGPGAVGIGWDLALIGLSLHIATGEPVDPAAFEAWSTTPDAVRFMRVSSDDWCAADVAGGADAADARARADRTTAAYTGEGSEGDAHPG